jgi:hypothetical protein
LLVLTAEAALAAHRRKLAGLEEAAAAARAAAEQPSAVAEMSGLADSLRAGGCKEAEGEACTRPVLVPASEGTSSTLISPIGTWRGRRP